MRVFHGVSFSASQPYILAKALRKQGVLAHAHAKGGSVFDFPTDFIIPEDKSFEKMLYLARIIDDYDVFHFHARPFLFNVPDLSYPTSLDLLMLRASGKKVYVHLRGSETRQSDVFRERSPWHYVDEDEQGLFSSLMTPNAAISSSVMRCVMACFPLMKNSKSTPQKPL